MRINVDVRVVLLAQKLYVKGCINFCVYTDNSKKEQITLWVLDATMQRLVLQQVLPWVQKPPLHRIPTTGHKAIQTVGDCQITLQTTSRSFALPNTFSQMMSLYSTPSKHWKDKMSPIRWPRRKRYHSYAPDRHQTYCWRPRGHGPCGSTIKIWIYRTVWMPCWTIYIHIIFDTL